MVPLPDVKYRYTTKNSPGALLFCHVFPIAIPTRQFSPAVLELLPLFDSGAEEGPLLNGLEPGDCVEFIIIPDENGCVEGLSTSGEGASASEERAAAAASCAAVASSIATLGAAALTGAVFGAMAPNGLPGDIDEKLTPYGVRVCFGLGLGTGDVGRGTNTD